MNSSRSGIHPSSPLDMLMASTQAGMGNIRTHIKDIKEVKKFAKAHCSKCSKEKDINALKICSRCKSAYYCDQACQVADYKARHKNECANFTNPPVTSAFLVKPVAKERFPPQPVFASGHEDGVGCWVSTEGRIDCDLQSFTDPLSPESESYSDRQLKIARGPDNGRGIIRRYKAASRSLLSLRVLVQNRRKERGSILVFGSRMQVVSYGSKTTSVMRGAVERDNLERFVREGVSYAAIGVAADPWDNVPRMEIVNFSGQEVRATKGLLPGSVKDAKEGIVALKQGDYAIFHLEFRIGDGETIAKDWEALSCLETIRIPYAQWDGTSAPSTLITSLPLAQSPASPAPSAPGDETAGPSPSPGRVLSAPFAQPAIRTHYADFIERGEEAHMRAHYGDARADMARNADDMMAMMGEMLLGSVAQAGNTDVLVQRLRDMGMGELAEKVVARGP